MATVYKTKFIDAAGKSFETTSTTTGTFHEFRTHMEHYAFTLGLMAVKSGAVDPGVKIDQITLVEANVAEGFKPPEAKADDIARYAKGGVSEIKETSSASHPVIQPSVPSANAPAITATPPAV